MKLTEQDLSEAQSTDLKTISYSWEQFNLKVNEFQIAARHGHWDDACDARDAALAYIECNLDAFARVYRRAQYEA